jgi:hypothetical protein
VNELDVALRLERVCYAPRDELLGAFEVIGEPPGRYTIELSVLWRTEGKGDEDMGVILFEEWSADDRPFDFDRPHAFRVLLPRAPLSYDGVLIKIRWLARARVRWGGSGEALAEESFQLGPLPAVAS